MLTQEQQPVTTLWYAMTAGTNIGPMSPQIVGNKLFPEAPSLEDTIDAVLTLIEEDDFMVEEPENALAKRKTSAKNIEDRSNLPSTLNPLRSSNGGARAA